MAPIKPLEEFSTEDLAYFHAQMMVDARKQEQAIQKWKTKLEGAAHRRKLLDAARAALETLIERAMATLALVQQQPAADEGVIHHCQQLAAKYRLALDTLPTVSARIPYLHELMSLDMKLRKMEFAHQLRLERAAEAARLLAERN